MNALVSPASVEPNRIVGFESEQKSSSGLIETQRVPPEDWDQYISQFDSAAQEQMYVFTKGRWPNVGYEPNLFYIQGKLVGGAMVMIQSLPLNMGKIAVVKWGPMLVKSRAPDAEITYGKIIETLIVQYADKRKMMVSVLPKVATSPVNMQLEHLANRGFTPGSQLKFPNRYLVNVKLNDEDARKSFAQKWRYHLNKSLKKDLSFEVATPDRLGEFDALYKAMNDRKKFADHSAYQTISDLMELEEEALRPALFFVRHEGRIVAGAIIYKVGETAVYLYGATNQEALPLRAGYFLHWEIIRWLRDNTKADWYDLGGTDGFQGLHQFKKGMVGTQGHIEPVAPVMSYASDIRARMAGNFAYFMRDRVNWLRGFVEKVRSDLATPDQKNK